MTAPTPSWGLRPMTTRRLLKHIAYLGNEILGCYRAAIITEARAVLRKHPEFSAFYVINGDGWFTLKTPRQTPSGMMYTVPTWTVKYLKRVGDLLVGCAEHHCAFSCLVVTRTTMEE